MQYAVERSWKGGGLLRSVEFSVAMIDIGAGPYMRFLLEKDGDWVARWLLDRVDCSIYRLHLQLIDVPFQCCIIEYEYPLPTILDSPAGFNNLVCPNRPLGFDFVSAEPGIATTSKDNVFSIGGARG